MPRLFVGLDLPISLKNQLNSFGITIANVRWVPKENLHLTLRFIGEAPRPLYQQIKDILQSINRPSFELSTTTLDIFRRKRGTQILMIGIKKNEDLINLQKEIDEKLKIIGVALEKKNFKPHQSKFISTFLKQIEQLCPSVSNRRNLSPLLKFASVI